MALKIQLALPTGSGGQKGLAREREASGLVEFLPPPSRLFSEARWACLRCTVGLLGLSAAGRVKCVLIWEICLQYWPVLWV